MTPVHGKKKAQTGELEVAKIEVETAREKVDAAEKDLSEKKAALIAACDKADEALRNVHLMEYENLSQKFKATRWRVARRAVSHFNSVRSRSDKEHFDMVDGC